MESINRRGVLWGLFGAGLATPSAIPASTSAMSGPRIKELAAARGLLFGSAFDDFVHSEPDYAELLRSECQILTSDYNLKFAAIRPVPGVSNFGPADRTLCLRRKE